MDVILKVGNRAVVTETLSSLAIPAPHVSRGNGDANRSIRLLTVLDPGNAVLGDIITYYLKNQPHFTHEWIEAADIVEGVDEIQSRKPDCVLIHTNLLVCRSDPPAGFFLHPWLISWLFNLPDPTKLIILTAYPKFWNEISSELSGKGRRAECLLLPFDISDIVATLRWMFRLRVW